MPPPTLPSTSEPHPERRHDFLAAFLTYLLPGMGQVMQGRIGKGVLFFVSLYALFFYGMMMGQWRNVWLPQADELPRVSIFGKQLEGPLKAISYRPQYAGQFFIGIAAWPAVVQYISFDKGKPEGGALGTYQREPEETDLNRLQRDGNKRWDLGWVFTVIAGALNMLVIYDAYAGPVIVVEEDKKKKTKGGEPPAPAVPVPPRATTAPGGAA